jgi:hypothetical protein
MKDELSSALYNVVYYVQALTTHIPSDGQTEQLARQQFGASAE